VTFLLTDEELFQFLKP